MMNVVEEWEPIVSEMIEEILSVDGNPDHIEFVGDVDGHLFVMHSLATKNDIGSRNKTKRIDAIVEKYTNILIEKGLHRND